MTQWVCHESHANEARSAKGSNTKIKIKRTRIRLPASVKLPRRKWPSSSGICWRNCRVPVGLPPFRALSVDEILTFQCCSSRSIPDRMAPHGCPIQTPTTPNLRKELCCLRRNWNVAACEKGIGPLPAHNQPANRTYACKPECRRASQQGQSSEPGWPGDCPRRRQREVPKTSRTASRYFIPWTVSGSR